MRLAAALLLGTIPLPAVAADAVCRAEYQRGFTDGVAAVNAQLGAVTAQMQRDVQAQVNAQLAQLESRGTEQLQSRLASAQDKAAAPATVERRTMPRLPPLVRAPGGGIAPGLPPAQAAGTAIARRPDPRIPADPAALPAGTTITISDPQNLPPELFRALMAYAVR